MTTVNLFQPEIVYDLDAQRRVREWIAALRSGKYPQARGALQDSDGFCCLGVACDLYDPSLWVTDDTLPDKGRWVYGVGRERSGFELPESIAGAYLLRDGCGQLRIGDEHTSLMSLNDDGLAFAEIADVIERELEATLAAVREARQ
jgi:hypothetical protein